MLLHLRCSGLRKGENLFILLNSSKIQLVDCNTCCREQSLLYEALHLPPVVQNKQVATAEKRRPRGIDLTLFFNNFCSCDLPSLISNKYAYADDLWLLHSLKI